MQYTAYTQDSCSAQSAEGVMGPQWGWLASCSIEFHMLNLYTHFTTGTQMSSLMYCL